MVENPVRSKLLAGGTALGVMAFEFFTPGLARVLKSGGAEFVLLDTEHSGAGMDTLKAAIAYARLSGLSPFVRVPGLARHLISLVLDAGALGVMVPMLETAEQARALVEYCRYRPLGTRGVAFGMAHDDYRGGPGDLSHRGGQRRHSDDRVDRNRHRARQRRVDHGCPRARSRLAGPFRPYR